MMMQYQLGLAHLTCGARRRCGAACNDQNKTRFTRLKFSAQSADSVLSNSTLKADVRRPNRARHARGDASPTTDRQYRVNRRLGVKQTKWMLNIEAIDVRVRTPQAAEPMNDCRVT